MISKRIHTIYAQLPIQIIRSNQANTITSESPKSNPPQHCFLDAEIPFLEGSSKRLVQMKLMTKEERYTTKVTGIELQIPNKDWEEWKQ
jgi:hypothetical protein